MTDLRTGARLFSHCLPRALWLDPAEYRIGGPMTTLGITRADFDIFLRELTEPILAFGLAGYQVPIVETVAPSYAASGGVGQDFDTVTIRIDLRGVQAEVTETPRDPALYPEKPHMLGGLVRFYLEPISLDGAPVNLSFDEAWVAAYVAEAARWVAEPMADFAARRYPATDGRAPKFVPRQGLGDFRDLLAEQAGKLTLIGAASTVEFFSGLRPNFDRPYPAGAAEQSETAGQYLRTLIDGVLVPMTMTLGRRLGDAAGAWFAADPAGRGPHPPGGLWALDPAMWAPGDRLDDAPAGVTLRRSPEQIMEEVRNRFARLYAALTTDIWLVEPGEEDRGARRLGLPRRGLMATGLAYAHLLRSADLAAPGLPPIHAGAMAAQRLIHYANGDPVVWDRLDPRNPDNPMTLRGAVWTMKDLGMRPEAFSAGLFAGRIRRNTALALSLALRAQIEEDEARNAAETWADRLDYLPWSLATFALFDAGLYSVLHRIGAAGAAEDEDETLYDVQAHLVPGSGRIVLTLPDYFHKGIEVSLSHDGLGYGLGEGVSWEYCPPAEPTGDKVLDAVRQALDPSHRLPKLKIVAAPGVAVEIKEWPEEAVRVHVFRVQDAELVPPRGNRIDDQLLTAPRTVTLEDLTDEAGIEAYPQHSPEEKAKLRSLLTAIAAETEKPVVAVRHVREGTKQGVEIEYVGRPPHERWPGMEGAAKVCLLLDQSSGRDRFAYSLEPIPARQQRVVGHMQEGPDRIPIYETIDVLRFRVVVHATVSVEIHAEDTGFGTVARDEPVFDHVYYRARATNKKGAVLIRNVADIAPLGCPLDYDLDPKATVVSTWLDHATAGAVVEARSQSPLVRDTGPVDGIEWRNLKDWLTLAADMGIGFIPFVGDVADVSEFLLSLHTGTDKWGKPISNLDRALMLGGVLLPFVSSAALKGMKSATLLADPTIPEDWLRSIPAGKVP